MDLFSSGLHLLGQHDQDLHLLAAVAQLGQNGGIVSPGIGPGHQDDKPPGQVPQVGAQGLFMIAGKVLHQAFHKHG